MALHIIYTDANLVISKKKYTGWEQIQHEYLGYKASLGPWSEDEVIEFLEDEYDNLFPNAATQINEFLNSSLVAKALLFS